MARRAGSTEASVVDVGIGKVRELRDLARRLEMHASKRDLQRQTPRLCADMLAAAEGLRYLCRALEVGGTDTVTIKAGPEPDH